MTFPSSPPFVCVGDRHTVSLSASGTPHPTILGIYTHLILTFYKQSQSFNTILYIYQSIGRHSM